jgi:transposase
LVPDKLLAFALQGGGTAPVEDRAVFTAVVFALTIGCSWRLWPPSFGVTVPTAHCRFTEWTKAGLAARALLSGSAPSWLVRL